ncbi:hypothetical protein INF30_12235 [Lachnospiraceae bacterium DSM 108991]|uniref:ABC-2 type transporter transmembrane domain-containing protein n=1 Tax=Claveliimonas monacensis TaxID=2779351 RepID=A0ABR9RMA6_9FIRM|nr:ABC transporter permease [Claveliimonas monacensis]MBE5064023.1 hypothetical protein [Claveliimonas monacensis]
MSNLANEIVKKDIFSVLGNKRLICLISLVPVILTLVMPSILIIYVAKSNIELDRFYSVLKQPIIDSMENFTKYEQKELIIAFFIDNILPIFFLLIPTMSSSIISANSFVGEKEKGTLETLYLSPIKVQDIFIAKVKVSIIFSMALNIIVFFVMCIELNILLSVLGFQYFVPGVRWGILLLITSLAITILSTTFVIKSSKKSETAEEAQQSAVFIILPIMALVVGQFAGLIFISDLLVIVVSLVLLIFSLAMLIRASSKVDYNC